MTLRRSRTHRILLWEDWVEVCKTYGEDPYECQETGYSLGGGDGVYFEYWGDYPDETKESE